MKLTQISRSNSFAIVRKKKSSPEMKMEHYDRILSILQHQDNNIHHLHGLRKMIDNFEEMFREDVILSINLWKVYYQLQAELL